MPTEVLPQPAGTQSAARSRELGASFREGLVTAARRALRGGRGRGRAGEGGGGAERGGGCGGFESASFLAAGAGVGLGAPAPALARQQPRSSGRPSPVCASRTEPRFQPLPRLPPLCLSLSRRAGAEPRPSALTPPGDPGGAARGARAPSGSPRSAARGEGRLAAARGQRAEAEGSTAAPLGPGCARGPGAAPRPPARGLPMVQRRSGCRRR